MSFFINFVDYIKNYLLAKNKFITRYCMISRAPKIRRVAILAIFYAWMPIPCYPVDPEIGRIEMHYVDWHSLFRYLSDHSVSDYASYEPITDIKKYGCNRGAWITFPQKIEAIEARVGNITTTLDLFRSKDFLAMYKYPRYYWEAFLDYIVDDSYTLSQKQIATYAMLHGPGTRERIEIAEKFYQLYNTKKINADVLELLLAVNIANHIRWEFEKEIWPNYHIVLKKIQESISKDSSLYANLSVVLSDYVLPKAWERYRVHVPCHGSGYWYYTQKFPFYASLIDALKDLRYLGAVYTGECCQQTVFTGLDTYPYFLLIMEHPRYSYRIPEFFRSTWISSLKTADPKCQDADGTMLLFAKGYTDQEKSMAVFGMSRLGLRFGSEFARYASILEKAIEAYKGGNLSVHHLEEFFKCKFKGPFKYPFFILGYKRKDVQSALDKFIAEPTIPEGLKALARKVKQGALATKEEMSCMEGYATFRKKHFTLYETIVPRGD